MTITSEYQRLVRWKDKRGLMSFLDFLDNALPFPDKNRTRDLELAFMNQKKDIRTRWRPWKEIRELPNFHPGMINQRLISLVEIVGDLDPPAGKKEIMLANAIKILDQLGYKYTLFETGSRGYHFHVFAPGLIMYERQPTLLTRMKRAIILKCGGDPAKANPRSLVALENSKHWKTQKPKRLILWKT